MGELEDVISAQRAEMAGHQAKLIAEARAIERMLKEFVSLMRSENVPPSGLYSETTSEIPAGGGFLRRKTPGYTLYTIEHVGDCWFVLPQESHGLVYVVSGEGEWLECLTQHGEQEVAEYKTYRYRYDEHARAAFAQGHPIYLVRRRDATPLASKYVTEQLAYAARRLIGDR